MKCPICRDGEVKENECDDCGRTYDETHLLLIEKINEVKKTSLDFIKENCGMRYVYDLQRTLDKTKRGV